MNRLLVDVPVILLRNNYQRCIHGLKVLWFLSLFASFSCQAGVGDLTGVTIAVPAAVAVGETATLHCDYQLETDHLYTVKWYRGRQEFFCFIPKELPNVKVYPEAGVSVDVSLSGAKQVVLKDVKMELAGKYRCEVSADAPSFHTVMVSAHMHVVAPPSQEPELKVERPRYNRGETLRANCTAHPSNPAANVTWSLNGVPVTSSDKVTSLQEKDEAPSEDGIERWTTVSYLEALITNFRLGRLRVQCESDVYGVFKRSAQLQLDDSPGPMVSSVRGSLDSSDSAEASFISSSWIRAVIVGTAVALVR